MTASVPHRRLHALLIRVPGPRLRLWPVWNQSSGRPITHCLPSAQVAKSAELKAKGIEKVFVYCVNDAAVMRAWAKDQNIDGTGLVTFWADNLSVLTKALGMEITHNGPCGDLGPGRCKRFVACVTDNVVDWVQVSEAPDDPAGDNDAEGPVTAETLVEKVLTLL